MTHTPRWLQRIRQQDRVARRAANNASNSQPHSTGILTWVAVATLAAAIIGILVTRYYGQRSEDAEIQEQYSRLIVQTHEYLPKMRAAEERTSKRLADIQAALATPKLTNQERECLEDMSIMAIGELEAIQSINRKLNELVSNSIVGPSIDTSASNLAEMLRRQKVTLELFDGRHAERYAQYNSTRVRECTEKSN